MDVFNLSSLSFLYREPEDTEHFNKWIEQGELCSFLEKEIQDEHIILYASIPYTFINSAPIPSVGFGKLRIQDLLKWDISPQFYFPGKLCAKTHG
jgi:hypothetical protein